MALRRRADGRGVIRRWDGSPFRVLALDPGGTTGWKSGCAGKEDPTKFSNFHFKGGQIGPNDHHLELEELLTQHLRYSHEENVPFSVVCESFEFRQHIDKDQAKTKVELISKEYIGVVRLFCIKNGLTAFFQSASDAKHMVPDKGPEANVKLKQLDLYETSSQHENDAARHLLRHMVVTKHIHSPITDIWLRDD